MKPEDIEDDLIYWDLIKSYGHFNILFENLIEEYRWLIIRMLKIGYNYYYDVEDDPENEQLIDNPDIFPMMMFDRMGAMEVVESFKAIFLELKKQQEKKFNQFAYYIDENFIIINKYEYELILKICKKSYELIKLRNNLIHSSFYSGYPQFFNGSLDGIKHIKKSTGYDKRRINLTINKLDKFNKWIEILITCIKVIQSRLINVDENLFKESFITQDIETIDEMNFNYEN